MTQPMYKRILSSLLIVFFLVGCTTTLKGPQLGTLYNRAAQYNHVERNPLIAIPGVLGSKLIDQESGKIVWGAYTKDYANPKNPEDARLIAIPMKEGVPLDELRNNVIPNGALDVFKITFLFLPINLSAYFNILRALGMGGYRDQQLQEAGVVDYGDEHFTCFQFDYDWRRDNVENAKLLHEYILEKRKYVQEEYEKRFGIKDYDVKFDIVAHSMGGLLTRYFLRYGNQDLPAEGLPKLTWGGARYVDKVILIGTPNAGSVDAASTLVEGLKLGPFFPYYSPALLGTMPALYQLLPRPRHKRVVSQDNKEKALDLYDPELWIDLKWGLADPTQDDTLKMLLPDKNKNERRQIALNHLRKSLKRAKQFTGAIDQPAVIPENLSLYLFTGDSEKTSSKVSVNPGTGKLKIIEKAPGDGRVTRASALMDERVGGEWKPYLVSPLSWSNVVFLFDSHLGLTMNQTFIDNLLYHLLEKPDIPQA